MSARPIDRGPRYRFFCSCSSVWAGRSTRRKSRTKSSFSGGGVGRSIDFKMCGITGFINAQGAADEGILRQMNCAIIHRGPDEDGFYLKDNVALAMRRLAIIDLAGGQQ